MAIADTSIEWTESDLESDRRVFDRDRGMYRLLRDAHGCAIESMGTAADYIGTTKRVRGKAVWTGKWPSRRQAF